MTQKPCVWCGKNTDDSVGYCIDYGAVCSDCVCDRTRAHASRSWICVRLGIQRPGDATVELSHQRADAGTCSRFGGVSCIACVAGDDDDDDVLRVYVFSAPHAAANGLPDATTVSAVCRCAAVRRGVRNGCLLRDHQCVMRAHRTPRPTPQVTPSPTPPPTGFPTPQVRACDVMLHGSSRVLARSRVCDSRPHRHRRRRLTRRVSTTRPASCAWRRRRITRTTSATGARASVWTRSSHGT
jgi:hypothetical protein